MFIQCNQFLMFFGGPHAHAHTMGAHVCTHVHRHMQVHVLEIGLLDMQGRGGTIGEPQGNHQETIGSHWGTMVGNQGSREPRGSHERIIPPPHTSLSGHAIESKTADHLDLRHRLHAPWPGHCCQISGAAPAALALLDAPWPGHGCQTSGNAPAALAPPS